MVKSQVNVKLERQLIREVERLVEAGTYRSKTDAFAEALKLLLRLHRGQELIAKMDSIRDGTETRSNASRAIIELHEEEDN